MKKKKEFWLVAFANLTGQYPLKADVKLALRHEVTEHTELRRDAHNWLTGADAHLHEPALSFHGWTQNPLKVKQAMASSRI